LRFATRTAQSGHARLTHLAEGGPLLQVRGGKTSTARADIQTTMNPEFFQHRRKAVWSPFKNLPASQEISGDKRLTALCIKRTNPDPGG